MFCILNGLLLSTVWVYFFSVLNFSSSDYCQGKLFSVRGIKRLKSLRRCVISGDGLQMPNFLMESRYLGTTQVVLFAVKDSSRHLLV